MERRNATGSLYHSNVNDVGYFAYLFIYLFISPGSDPPSSSTGEAQALPSPVQVFDKTLLVKQMHILEPQDLLITRADKGEGSFFSSLCTSSFHIILFFNSTNT